MTEVNARLIAINLLFKFEVSSFIRSKDMTGDPKCRNGPLDFDHAHTRTVSHHMVNSCTKIEVFSFGRSRDIPGVFKIVKWSRDHDHAPFRMIFFIGRLGLATALLYAQLEVSICNSHEYMKSGAKCRK